MIVLDATVVNVALPAIQNDLGFTQSSLAWVVNAYLIAFGGLLLLSGRLGDLISRRDVFLVGLTVFTASSLLCGFAQSDVMLVAFRFFAGVGGALTAAVVLGMIVTMFPEPSEQAKAIGVYAFVASAGGSVGLLAGGVLTQLLSWHWIFFINIPIGIATGYYSLKLLERDKGLGLSHGADILGAVLITSSLMLGVFTIVEPAAKDGWGDPTTLVCSIGSFLLLVAFLVRESTIANPLVPLRIFKSRNVSGANAVQALTVAGMFGLFFLGVLYLQEVLGYDALQTGFAFLPTTLVMGTLSVKFSEPLIMRFGARNCLIVGLVLIAIGLALFARVPVDGNYWTDVLPSTLLLGSGVGVCFPSLMTLAMSGATKTDAGLASGLVNTTAQVGAAIGLAVLATIAANKTDALTAAGKPHAEALVGGYEIAFWVAAGLVVVALIVAFIVLEPARAPEGQEGEPTGPDGMTEAELEAEAGTTL
ncbi:MAG: DHA2 family efflux MFS transporter permease subunit [Solirubrobacterales bacterium]|nr:DHA2 family efflux MFS transporter permease subunit [Solirubrobacterales bacterium]MCB8916130.1 DHA2 family efflux MFS transporter permease subunit [Thermoleophilales bacterium]